MNLHSSQIIIAKDTRRFRIVCAGRRFGKSMLSSEEIKGKAVAKPSVIVYIAPTYQQARDIMWEILLKELRPIIVDKNESRLEITVKTLKGGESKIILRGWESIETLRGISVDFVVIDEISSMRNFFMYWNEVIRPCLSDRKGEGLFISTPKGFNHFYDLYNKENLDPDYKSFNFSTYDNPFIPVEEIDKARLELPEDTFAQEYLAQFRKREGLVYPEFSRKKHLYETKPDMDWVDTLVGIDWGYTNPCAIVKIYVSRDYDYYIEEESYERQKTKDYNIEIAKNMKPTKVYADPEDPEACQLAGEWLNVRPVNKNIVTGIDTVRELFKQNKIYINKKCTNLINELEQYAYPDKKDGKNGDEKPIKEMDHLCDATRYCLFNYNPENNENTTYTGSNEFDPYGDSYQDRDMSIY
jgi:PBSX family phage terminase large subunit